MPTFLQGNFCNKSCENCANVSISFRNNYRAVTICNSALHHLVNHGGCRLYKCCENKKNHFSFLLYCKGFKSASKASNSVLRNFLCKCRKSYSMYLSLGACFDCVNITWSTRPIDAKLWKKSCLLDMSNIKISLHQTPSYQRYKIFQIFWKDLLI